MEPLPFQTPFDGGAERPVRPGAHADPAVAATGPAWTTALPVMRTPHGTLREVRRADARSLLACLTSDEVTRFISPPPTTLDGFERFVAWTHGQRAAGEYACFAVVPRGQREAVGIFQVRSLEARFRLAEWGFALASPYWGRGLFIEGAHAVIEFTFEVLGAHRLEARASVENGRGNRALEKLGAVREGRLRQSFRRNGQYHDQYLWAILSDDHRHDGVLESEHRRSAPDRFAPLIVQKAN